MAWTPPVGVTPLDRRNPNTANEADLQDMLDWLKASYPGNTVLGTFVTGRDTGRTYRVDSNARPYTLTPVLTPTQLPMQRASDLGVRGDGVDASAALTAALAAYGHIYLDGRVVTPRVYALRNVQLPAGAQIVLGPGARLELAPGAAAGDYFFRAPGTAGAKRRGIRLTGMDGDGGGVMAGLASLVYADHPVIEQCRITGAAAIPTNQGQLLALTHCTGASILDCEVDGAYYGVNAYLSSGTTVQGGSYKNLQRDGVLFYGSDYNRAIGVEVDGYGQRVETGRAAIHFYGGRHGTAVGCIVKNGANDASGIRSRNYDLFSWSGNEVDNAYNAYEVVRITNADDNGDGTVDQVNDYNGIVPSGSISGNTAANSRYNGFAVSTNCGTVQVTGNTAVNSYQHGVSIATSGTPVADNSVLGAGAAGIAVSAVAANVTVSGGTVKNAGTRGVNQAGVLVLGTGANINGVTFLDDQAAPTMQHAVRIGVGGSASVGVNNYGPGVTNRLYNEGTLLRESAPFKFAFSGPPYGAIPGGPGNVESAQVAIDASGRTYRAAFTGSTAASGAGSAGWERVVPKLIQVTLALNTTTAFAHGLGYTPTRVWGVPRGANAGKGFQFVSADVTNIAVKCVDAAGDFDVFVQ